MRCELKKDKRRGRELFIIFREDFIAILPAILRLLDTRKRSFSIMFYIGIKMKDNGKSIRYINTKFEMLLKNAIARLLD